MTLGQIDGLVASLDVQLAVVLGLAEGDLSLVSRCPGWSIGAVLRHSLGVTEKLADFASGRSDSPRTPRGDLLVPDHRTSAERTIRTAQQAWSEVDLGRTCHLPFGDFGAAEAAGINLFDVLAHTWDMAEAVGVELWCPGVLWEAGRRAAVAVLGRSRDVRHYGGEILVPGEASPKDRFLAYLGRDPVTPASE